ncbi:MAG: sulfotransferase [Hyphomicrobiaceae bacterium]
MPASAIIVLGMHRSGTSSLAGMLEAGGLHLGTVNTAAAFNKKGNRENADVMRLNDAVLANTGSDWRNPPAGAAIWNRDNLVERDAIAERLGERQPWGFKDPRALLTLDGWLPILADARFVATFRHPKRVARSLASRPGPLHVPIHEGLRLWQTYNERLLAFMETRPVELVDFDSPPDKYLARVRAMCDGLGLDVAKAETFFAHELRVSDDGYEAEMSPQIIALHAQLKARAATPI